MEANHQLRVLGLLTLLAACGGGDGGAPTPVWSSLSKGHQPEPGVQPGGFEVARASGEAIEVQVRPAETGATWFELDVAAADWSRGTSTLENRWLLELPGFARLRREADETARLSVDGTLLPAVRENDRGRPTFELGLGAFECRAEELTLVLPPGKGPPETARLSLLLERGFVADEEFRVVLGDRVADGLSVWPGESVRIRNPVSPGSALRFETALRARPGTRAVFRVEQGDQLLHESELLAGEDLVRRAHHVPLENDADEFVFSVTSDGEGEPQLTAFLEPTIGPAEVGDYGDRPWGNTRPDVLVLLIDTFRADNLAVCGGEPDVAPNLNQLVERSLVFRNARAPSVWTLPSHASMFTGMFPLQHGAVTRERTFSQDLVTLAEHFRASGYRTGAVTDAAFVSLDFGMDQGFSSFEERPNHKHDLSTTFEHADAFLERDDGRPVFLFVHTYRVHEPYRVGLEEDPGPGEELKERVLRNLRGLKGDELTEALRSYGREYLSIYREGVRAFDEEFGRWLKGLEDRDAFANGVLLVTSDHGEEFFEHGKRRHGGKPHEEKVRVPLLLFGTGITPAIREESASLLDVPTTLGVIARLPELEAWQGSSLFDLPPDRPVFAYNGDEEGSGYFAVVRGNHKLFAQAASQRLAEGMAEEAYDLASDPAEQESLSPARAPWAAGLARDVAEQWEWFATPSAGATSVELGGGAAADLKDLGYVE